MFKLLRLPLVILKWVVVVSLIVFGLLLFPEWAAQINVSSVVQAVQDGVEWMIEQVGKHR